MSRLVHFLFGRRSGKDFVATPKEAKRIAKPLTRYLLRRFDVDDWSVSDKRDLIATGLSAGEYVARAGFGEPGGSGVPAEAFDEAFEPPAATVEVRWAAEREIPPVAPPMGSPSIRDAPE